jgi:acyl-CoA dehydrogenase
VPSWLSSGAIRLPKTGKARTAGVLAPQAPAEFGGGGADLLTTALLLEEAGYSPLGPLRPLGAARSRHSHATC